MNTKAPINKNYRAISRTTGKISTSYKPYTASAQPKKRYSPYTSISTIGNNVTKKISINDEILHKRKENYLNTQYNKRVTTLKEITKENKKIYERINSQKSLYSQDDLRKSTTSIKSTSRVSNKSSTSQKKRNNKTIKTSRENAQVKIQPENINSIKVANISQFQSMFVREKHRPANIFNINSINMNLKKQNRSFSLRQDQKGNQSQGMGNILHKIAEQIYKVPENKVCFPNRKRLLY